MRKFTEKFLAWCNEDTPVARFERTVAQGVVGVAAGLVGAFVTGEGIIGVVLAPTVMAVLSPIQAAIGRGNG